MPLYDVAGGGGVSELGKDEIYDFLSDDKDEKEVIDIDDKKDKSVKDDKKEPKEEKEEESDEDSDDEADKNEEEIDELTELEEDLEEPDEEKLELVTPVRRAEIIKKYPEIFKDFPYLEKAYYREQQFTEIYATIPEAREAREKAETLDNVERDLNDGNTELLLKSIHGNKKAFGKIVDNYLSVLSNVDKDAYLHVVGNTIKHTIAHMVSEARKTGNSDLQSAAHLLNQFTFGTSEWSPPEKMIRDSDNKEDPKAQELENRERTINRREFDRTNSEVSDRINNAIRSTIDQHIDPKKSMTDYVRKHAVSEAIDQTTKLIKTDKRFSQLVDKLWEKAIKSNYDKKDVDNIRSAFLSKAKTLLPTVIKQARNEALRGMGKRVSDDSSDKESKSDKSDKSSKNESRNESRSHSKSDKKSVPSGMSSLEYLMADD